MIEPVIILEMAKLDKLCELKNVIEADVERVKKNIADSMQDLRALAENRSGFDDLVVDNEIRAYLLAKMRRDKEYLRRSISLLVEIKGCLARTPTGELLQQSLHCPDRGHPITDFSALLAKIKRHDSYFCPHCVAKMLKQKMWWANIYAV